MPKPEEIPPDFLAACRGAADALKEAGKMFRLLEHERGHGQMCDRHEKLLRDAIEKAEAKPPAEAIIEIKTTNPEWTRDNREQRAAYEAGHLVTLDPEENTEDNLCPICNERDSECLCEEED